MKRILTALLCATLLSACGFQLRGKADLPYASLYIALPEASTLRAKLVRSIRAGSKTTIADAAASSQAVLGITGDSTVKNILSLNSAGRVREYQLVRTFGYRVHDQTGRDLIPPGQIVLQRDHTFDDSQVLAKQTEEDLLIRDMEDDIVQQLLRRLAASKPDFAAKG
ncbi:LPS-assembly lipoprotein LptE [Georgfuchsia toluolica]|uniref:LPS-assembly lipoprotein LptE n=1 Tax=Georgfuchsia toluolica TaxID=424218 RepID=A0A916NA47_9PROT|nr:LPS assembly lipoprotein LptE [Georgfuchsia toluolica]CAG4884892.1 LPS-assembly lipoprotein LptE [Georgfuchsia toluolica]